MGGDQTEFQALYAVLSMFAFVLGCMVGSFLNVCVYRLPRGLSVVKPRSRCPKCESSIVWYDNIPVLSWLVLGAKCRNCKNPISWQYPLVEAITGLLFFLVFWKFEISIATPIYMVLAAALVLVTFVDLTDWTIPDSVSLPGIPIGIVVSLVAMFYPESRLVVIGPFDQAVFNSLLGVLVGGGSLYALDKIALLLLKKPGMGFGDVKLNAMLGAFFGLGGVILVIVLASFVGALIGIIQMVASKPKPVSAEAGDGEGAESGEPGAHYLPFGPYLSLAAMLVMFFGAELVRMYFDFLRGPAY
ncbi:MAG: prepilin peptidase [Candidatus Hydrogenedentota bacterium]